MFDFIIYWVNVLEDVFFGFFVMKVKVFDVDEGLNVELEYIIELGNDLY